MRDLLVASPCGSVHRVTDRSDPAGRRTALSEALQHAGRGEKAALESIYRATSAKLFGICLRILKDRQEAEDVLQTVYVSVWQRAGTFDSGRASPITWLATLARNRSIDRLRTLRRSASFEPVEAAGEIADDRPDALASLESREDARRLNGCIGELEDRTARAVRSAFFDGATYSDLAERAGVPLGTMKSWIRRGLMKLKECLER